jgi:hypothetical protein
MVHRLNNPQKKLLVDGDNVAVLNGIARQHYLLKVEAGYEA